MALTNHGSQQVLKIILCLRPLKKDDKTWLKFLFHSAVGFLMPATGLLPALGTVFVMKACAFYTSQLLELQ